MKIKMVIFDLDETIVKNEIPFAEMKERILRKIGSDENPPHLYEFLKEKGEEYLKILEEEEIRRAMQAKPVESLPKILDYLDFRGIKKAIITRNSKKAVRIALGELVNRFDEIITRDDDFAVKPSSEAIFYLLKKYRVKGKDCLMVGDYEYDIIAGKRAECITVRVGEGSGDYRVKDVGEIIEIIENLQ